jgi:hypothetical protein
VKGINAAKVVVANNGIPAVHVSLSDKNTPAKVVRIARNLIPA